MKIKMSFIPQLYLHFCVSARCRTDELYHVHVSLQKSQTGVQNHKKGEKKTKKNTHKKKKAQLVLM